VVGYAPVLSYKLGGNGKYWFRLGEIEPLAISPGDLTLRNLRYTKLEDLLDAGRRGMTLEELFNRHSAP
jgi:hypothetical protein